MGKTRKNGMLKGLIAIMLLLITVAFFFNPQAPLFSFTGFLTGFQPGKIQK